MSTVPRRAITKDYQQLWKGVASATDETQAIKTLAEILTDKEGKVVISQLDSGDAELCIDILGNGIAEHNLKPAEKQAFFVMLRRLAERHGRLPDRMRITDKIEISDELLASSGFADLRSGTYREHPVAIKTLRVTARDDFAKIRRRFFKEVVLWSTLSHPNILKLVGVQEDMKKRQFAIVSEWMSHGNIMEFIENNRANRLDLLYGAVQGLKYLHGVSLTHGDLKGVNILISNNTPPHACLADFGFMSVVPDPVQPIAHSAQLEGGPMTFMSPELLIPEEFGKKDAVPTPQSDIYAFGLVIFQVLTGEMPFCGIRQSALAYHVLRGTRPTKPENASAIGFSDSLWEFTQNCWDGEMELRPKVGEVVTRLREAAASWDGVMPPRSQAWGVASGPEEVSHSKKHSGDSQPFSIVPASPTESEATYGPLTPPDSPPVQWTELPRKGSQETVGVPFKEPQPKSWSPMQPRSEDSHGFPHSPKIFSHPGHRYDPPPSQKRWKGLGHYVRKVLGLFGLLR